MTFFRPMTQTKSLKLGTYIGEFATPGIGHLLNEKPRYASCTMRASRP